VPVEIGRSYTDQGWGQQILPFERFLRLVGFPDAPPADEAELEKDREYDGLPLYLAQHALFAQFPELENDFTLPDYVYSEPPAPEDMPEYASPGNADGVVVNVWIGSGKQKVISPAHTVSPTVD
jgi:lysine-specific demethylase 8